MVKLAGSIADLTAAFRTNLKRYRVGRKIFRGRTGPLSVPKELAVLSWAFSAWTIARSQAALSSFGQIAGGGRSTRTARALPRNALDGSFTPLEVARLYNFPSGLNGRTSASR